MSTSMGIVFPSMSRFTIIGWDALDPTFIRYNISLASLSSPVLVSKWFVLAFGLILFFRHTGPMWPFYGKKLQAPLNLHSLVVWLVLLRRWQGFLCCTPPWDGHFCCANESLLTDDSTGVSGFALISACWFFCAWSITLAKEISPPVSASSHRLAGLLCRPQTRWSLRLSSKNLPNLQVSARRGISAIHLLTIISRQLIPSIEVVVLHYDEWHWLVMLFNNDGVKLWLRSNEHHQAVRDCSFDPMTLTRMELRFASATPLKSRCACSLSE